MSSLLFHASIWLDTRWTTTKDGNRVWEEKGRKRPEMKDSLPRNRRDSKEKTSNLKGSMKVKRIPHGGTARKKVRTWKIGVRRRQKVTPGVTKTVVVDVKESVGPNLLTWIGTEEEERIGLRQPLTHTCAYTHMCTHTCQEVSSKRVNTDKNRTSSGVPSFVFTSTRFELHPVRTPTWESSSRTFVHLDGWCRLRLRSPLDAGPLHISWFSPMICLGVWTNFGTVLHKR